MILALDESSEAPVSPRVRREALDANLDRTAQRLVIERRKRHLADPAFWLDLCPALTLTRHPCAPPSTAYPIPHGLPAACEQSIALDGYFATPPVVEPDDALQLVQAANALHAAGLPTGFVAVYDEFWRLFHRLRGLVEPLLGDDCLLVPDGLWTFVVPPGDSGRSGLSSAGPHRDSIGADPHLLATGRPGILNLWIALSDATPLSSCIYVLPASLDDEYVTRVEPPPAVRLQDVRALPAEAGSVLGWTPHLLHWGSRASARAAAPRVSVALYLQRRELGPYGADATSFADAIPFEQRLSWIARSMGRPDLVDD